MFVPVVGAGPLLVGTVIRWNSYSDPHTDESPKFLMNSSDRTEHISLGSSIPALAGSGKACD